MFGKLKDDRSLSRFLDGEESEEVLSRNPRLKDEARELARLKRELGELGEVDAPGDLEAAVMRRVRREEPGGRLYTFLFRPRWLLLRTSVASAVTAAVLLVAALFAAFHLVVKDEEVMEARKAVPAAVPAAVVAAETSGGQRDTVFPAGPDTARRVEFSVHIPSARSVKLVGDFNDWSDEGIALEDPDEDGMWAVELELEPGTYQYLYLVNGEKWMVDERADARVDDGFGSVNSMRYVL